MLSSRRGTRGQREGAPHHGLARLSIHVRVQWCRVGGLAHTPARASPAHPPAHCTLGIRDKWTVHPPPTYKPTNNPSIHSTSTPIHLHLPDIRDNPSTSHPRVHPVVLPRGVHPQPTSTFSTPVQSTCEEINPSSHLSPEDDKLTHLTCLSLPPTSAPSPPWRP